MNKAHEDADVSGIGIIEEAKGNYSLHTYIGDDC